MPRIRVVEMDGVSVKISPLTYDEAEQYINEGKALFEKQIALDKNTDKLEPEQLQKAIEEMQERWANRTLETVVRALNKAGAEPSWDVKKLRGEFDMEFIKRVYREFMDMSGMLATSSTSGGVPATSTSR
jgi:transcriptional accessory protein Tex/SPT6